MSHKELQGTDSDLVLHKIRSRLLTEILKEPTSLLLYQNNMIESLTQQSANISSIVLSIYILTQYKHIVKFKYFSTFTMM